MKALLLLAFCSLLPVMCSAASEVSRVLEAENFQPAPGSHWSTIRYGQNYFVDAIGAGYISNEKLLSAPEQCAPSSASLISEIPRAGKYRVWVHFEAPKDYNVCFGLRVEQGGRAALDARMGGAKQVKLWPLNWGYHTQINPSYGGGDNVAWQGCELELDAGQARFTLYTLVNPRPAARRNIDVLYLTSDTSEKPKNLVDPFLDELPQPGRLWVRVRNTGSATLDPSLGDFHVNRRDWSLRETGIDRDFGPIEPGSASRWKDIGRAIDTIHATTISFNVRSKNYDAQIELAHAPGDTVTWRRQWTPDEDPIYVWVPVDLDFRQTKTSGEILRAIAGYIEDLPRGTGPEKIRFAAATPGPAGEKTGSHFGWLDLFYRLGYASPMTSPDQTEDEFLALLGGDANRRAIGVTHTDPNTSPQALENQLSDAKHAAMRRYVDVYSIGDEISLNGYAGEAQQSFAEYLKVKGIRPDDAGLTSCVDVKPEGPGDNPVLYVEGRNYRNRNAIQKMAAITGAITKAFQAKVHVAANYAPHPCFVPDVWQWVDVFKYGGLTMPWSEDYAWQVPVVSSQIIGFSLDVMRCAAKYHDLPMTYYCMPHSPGNTSDDFRRSNYLALGRGVKIINHFSLGPQMFATENYVDWRDSDRWREIYRIIHEVGPVDDLLYSGKPPRAQVAVLMSRYSDLWEKSEDGDVNVFGVERQSLWLALKHLQMPVDLITDEDICEHRLDDYKVLFLAGPNIARAAADEIKRWVQSGGVLFASAGGGLKDEYNRPLDTLLSVYGLRWHTLSQNPGDRMVRVKMELPRMKPLGELSFSGDKPIEMEVLAVSDALDPLPGARILATLPGDKTGAVMNQFGLGKAYLIGAMPGLAYVKPAIPMRPYDRNEFTHFLPTDFDANVRNLIALPLQDASISPAVWCSSPLVEGDVIQSDKGGVVSLVNFTDKPINSLTVRVRTAKKPSRAWAVRAGSLPFRYAKGEVTVSVRLDVTDFLVLE